MNIHIDIGCRHFEIDEIRHLLSNGNKSVESALNSLVEIRMLHIAPIYEEILMSPFLLGRLRFSHKAMNVAKRRIDLHGQQVLIQALSEDIDNALTEAAFLEIKQFRIIAMQRESH